VSAPAALPGIMWHVTLIVSGAPASLELLRLALEKLCALDPQNMGARYSSDRAELQFWDQGVDVAHVAASAADLWRSSQRDTGLPDWAVVALEVMDRDHWRVHTPGVHPVIAPGSVAVQP